MNKQKDNQGISAINWVFLLLIVGSILLASFNGNMGAVKDASFSSARAASELALKLIGIMALWLGLVRILEAAGFMQAIARAIKPLMVRLFPDVPAEHPAMGAMILNVSANMLGLGNAATPFGIKAMIELNKLNPFPGVATNAMCLFLAINTSSVTILPLGAIAIRAAAGANDPSLIILPSILATLCSTIVGISVAMLLAKLDSKYKSRVAELSENMANEEAENTQNQYSHLIAEYRPTYSWLIRTCWLILFCGLGYSLFNSENKFLFIKDVFLNDWLIPLLVFWMLAYGFARGVRVYEAVVEGAKQGFEIAIKIIPYLVAILVAIAIFRASGAEAIMVYLLSPLTNLINLPAETLTVALLRPLSGTGSFAAMSALVEQAPNSYAAFVAATMQGSTETTFYVLAVYFGAIGVSRIRHTLIAAILADITGIIASAYFCSIFWD